MAGVTRERQAQLDAMTFEMFVDCGRNATAAARQLGVARSTVKARVRRYALRDAREAAAARRAASG